MMKLKRQISTVATVVAIFAMLPAVVYSFQTGDFSPNPFSGLFSLNGSFTLNQNFLLGEATITNANVQLSGPTPSNPLVPLSTAAGVEAWLEGETFVAVPSIAGLNVWQSPLFSNGFEIAVDNVSANQLATIAGGVIPLAVDSDSFSFSATATAVPEPASFSAFLLLGISFLANRGRRRSALGTS